jgi:hypothetical protein
MGAGASGSLGGRTIRLLTVAVVAAVLGALVAPAAGAASSAGDGRRPVIVQARPGAVAAAARLVTQSAVGSAVRCR